MKKWSFGLLIAFSSVAGTWLFIRATGNDFENRKAEFNARYGIYALDLPAKVSFASEEVPLHITDVRERFDRELLVNTYWQSQTLLMLKRKERWFPVIEPILKANHIPDDFKYLAMAESGFTNTVSPSGASGFWQFLEGTGKHYDLEINSEVDERYHLEKATQAACRYFQEAYDQFGSWSLTAASYNMGIEGVRRQLEKQKADDYYDLLLVEETSRYVFRILALKIICENPVDYGFHLRKRDFYAPLPFRTITPDSTITDLAAFAIREGTNYKELKLMNPWLRANVLTAKPGKKFIIKIPVQQSSPPYEDNADTTWMRALPRKEYHQE